MIDRRYDSVDSADLIAILNRRGFAVFKANEFRILQAEQRLCVAELETVGRASPAALAADVQGRMVTQLAEELVRFGPLTVSRYEEGGGAVVRYRSRLALVPLENLVLDVRPAMCRNRLEDEGKPHPKSGCQVGGCGGVFAPACRRS